MYLLATISKLLTKGMAVIYQRFDGQVSFGLFISNTLTDSSYLASCHQVNSVIDVQMPWLSTIPKPP